MSLKISLSVLPELVETAKSVGLAVFDKIDDNLDRLNDYVDLIERTIKEDAPNQLKEGGLLKEEVDAELDYLRDLMYNVENWLKDFEQREKERTGINILKVGYNKVFG